MNRTTHYNLGLWEGTDYPNYTMPNENMNIIDTNLKTIDERSVESKSKADACLAKIGNVDIQNMQERVLSNSVGVATNKSLIDNLEDSIGTITSPTKTEVGKRVIRSVEVGMFTRGIDYTENIAFYSGAIDITPDRLGLNPDDEIRVLSVTPTTNTKLNDNKNNYLAPITYVGKRSDGTHCFSSSGFCPNPNDFSDVYVIQPTGFIVEFIKL